MTKEGLKQYLRNNGLAYMAVETLYENALYVPFVVRQRLYAILRGLRAGGPGVPAGQSVMTWDTPFSQCNGPVDLARWLRSRGVEVKEGGHTLYIPPQPALRHIIPSIADFYPAHAGFKILRDFRDPLHARYIYKHPRSLTMLNRLIGAPRDQLIAANYMHALGIGPRVWDLCCWRAPEKSCTVFVVDHVTGRQPTIEQCSAFLARLERLTAQTHLRILVPGWRRSMDFLPPDCNRNLLYSDALGRVQYVDFQNFGLTDRAAWWAETAVARNLGNDSSSIVAALGDAGVDVGGRLVLHAGCGNGVTLHAVLARGAAWAIGWDRADTIRSAGVRLLARGSARFTLIAADAGERHDLADDIPRHLRPQLPRAVVVCEAGGADRARLERVFELPWSVLVCEGDGSESPDEIAGRLRSLAESSRRGCLDVIASTRIEAGSGTFRPLVVVRRQGADESVHAGLEQAG